jgi:hypothetical protein
MSGDDVLGANLGVLPGAGLTSAAARRLGRLAGAESSFCSVLRALLRLSFHHCCLVRAR